MFVQLNPPVPLETSKGRGMALGIIDYGTEYNLIWVVALDKSGEMWCLKNSDVRAQMNITFGRITNPPPAEAANREWWHSRAMAGGVFAGMGPPKSYGVRSVR